MNSVNLLGNLTKDPQVSATKDGLQRANFTLAVQREYVDKQTGKREADFIQCVAWRNTAEFIGKHCKKGSKVAVTGSLSTRSYDAQDGSKRYVTEVIVSSTTILTWQNEPTPAEQEAPKPAENTAEGFSQVVTDELPF